MTDSRRRLWYDAQEATASLDTFWDSLHVGTRVRNVETGMAGEIVDRPDGGWWLDPVVSVRYDHEPDNRWHVHFTDLDHLPVIEEDPD